MVAVDCSMVGVTSVMVEVGRCMVVVASTTVDFGRSMVGVTSLVVRVSHSAVAVHRFVVVVSVQRVPTECAEVHLRRMGFNSDEPRLRFENNGDRSTARRLRCSTRRFSSGKARLP